ncbi:MAG: hypothetical protein ABSD85_16405 [Acidimicrobiales bacterium]|jgi:hypothetical protein
MVKSRPLTRSEVGGLADTLKRWMALIENGDLRAGPAFCHELAGALTVLEVALGQEPSLVSDSLFRDDERPETSSNGTAQILR